MEWVEGARAEAILSRWLASVVDDNGEEEEDRRRGDAMVKRQQTNASVQLFNLDSRRQTKCCPFNFFI